MEMANCKCTVSSELMKNHMNAKLLPAQAEHEVVLTSEGHTMIFCVSREGGLNLVIERPGTKTGWSITNLGSDLGPDVVAKHISVAYGTPSTEIWLAVSFKTSPGVLQDSMSVLCRLPLADDSEWMVSESGRKDRWFHVNTDGLPSSFHQLSLASVMVYPARSSGEARTGLPSSVEINYGIRGVSVEVARDSRTNQKYVLFYNEPQCRWREPDRKDSDRTNVKGGSRGILDKLGSLSTGAGRSHHDDTDSQATGRADGRGRDRDSCGPIRFEKTGSGYCSLSRVSGPCTVYSTLPHIPSRMFDLVFSVKDKLLLRPLFGKSSVSVHYPLESELEQLCYHESDEEVSVWGLNQKGEVFYSKCSRGSNPSDEDSWSYPVPLLSGVSSMSSCVNPRSGAATVLAQRGDEITLLRRDTVTTHWCPLMVTLPTDDPYEMVEYTSYTTRIRLTKANGLPLENHAVPIVSSSPYSVYINDKFQVLDPDNAVTVQTDCNGIVTVVQATSGLDSVYLYLKLEGGVVTVNPMSKALDTLSAVKSGKDLAKVRIPDGTGGKCRLVPSDVSQENLDAVAKGLQNLMDIAREKNAKALGKHGAAKVRASLSRTRFHEASVQGASSSGISLFHEVSVPREESLVSAGITGIASALSSTITPLGVLETAVSPITTNPVGVFSPLLSMFGMSTGEQSVTKVGKVVTIAGHGRACSDEPIVRRWGLDFSYNSVKYWESQGKSVSVAISTTAGDIWRRLESGIEQVEKFFVEIVNDVATFFIRIGEEIYKFIATVGSNILDAVKVVFNAIKVSAERLMDWLGFVFEWGDIVRTHKVLHNITRQYLRHAVTQVGSCKGAVSDIFAKARQQIDSWAGLDSIKEGSSIGSMSEASPRPEAVDSPQANWGVHHLSHNARAANTPSFSFSSSTDSVLDGKVRELAGALGKEAETIERACTLVKEKIVNEIESLTVGEIFKRILGILGDFLVGTVENIVLASIDVLEKLVQGALAILDAEINIPVISSIYRKISGSSLTILDVLCLVVAIPATVVFKAIEGKAPYPADDAFTQELVSAKSWLAIQGLFQSDPTELEPQVAFASSPDYLRGMRLQVASAPPDGAKHDDSKRKTVLSKVLRIVSGFGSFALSAMIVVKKKAEDITCDTDILGTLSLLSALQFTCFVFTTTPTLAVTLISDAKADIKWTVSTIYLVTVVQNLAGIKVYDTKKSWFPFTLRMLDCIFGAAAIIPIAIQLSRKHDLKAIVASSAGLVLSLNRMLTPFTKLPKIKKLPSTAVSKIEDGILGIKVVLISVHGLLQFVVVLL